MNIVVDFDNGSYQTQCPPYFLAPSKDFAGARRNKRSLVRVKNDMVRGDTRLGERHLPFAM